MKKVLFICLGNICRSPMAEFILKDKVSKAGLDDLIYVESAATSYEESGEPVYYMAVATLSSHGIQVDTTKRARRTTKSDYDKFDLIVCMDKSNITNATAIYGGDPEQKIKLLMDYTEEKGKSVSDPWYTRNFETTYQDVNRGCQALLKYLSAN